MTIDAEFLKNYSIANQKDPEDALLMLNMMTGGKPRLESTTEPREYRAPGEYCTESTFARDCLGAEMMGAWDAEVGRPTPDMASESYRQSYARKREKMTLENAKHCPRLHAKGMASTKFLVLNSGKMLKGHLD